MKVFLSGVSGAMGQYLQTLIADDPELEIVGGLDANADESGPFPVYNDLSGVEKIADVIIDFSHFSAFDKIFDYALASKTPIVIATTGLDDADLQHIQEGAKEIPVFKTANMSLGINILAKALKEMAGPLEAGFDIEIVERHHNKKVDAPSGTALLLADAVNAGLIDKKTYSYGRHGRDSKRQAGELGIHAVRGGTIPGDHEVIFAGTDEVIEVRHSALSKKVFAAGAIKAAKFLAGQEAGLYDMQALLAQG